MPHNINTHGKCRSILAHFFKTLDFGPIAVIESCNNSVILCSQSNLCDRFLRFPDVFPTYCHSDV